MSKVHTSLTGKEYEPMIIRRISTPILHWVSLISGDNLDPLDDIIQEFWKTSYDKHNRYSIQDMRNLTGELQDKILEAFPKTEGLAVIVSADKMIISSLYGDFMNHDNCKRELMGLLNLSTGI